MERFIAIDNVCAWPNLTLLPNGAIAAVIFGKPNHGVTEGDVECWISGDEGRTWVRGGVPSGHLPNQNRMNVAAGLATDGSLVVLSSGWDDVSPANDPARVSGQRGNILPARVSRSSDGGLSWTIEGGIELPKGTEAVIPFGDIVSSGDGTLGSACYSYSRDAARTGRDAVLNRSWFVRSCDQGKSWVNPRPIAPIKGNETAIVALGDSRLLAAVRTWESEHLELFGSDDFGDSWSPRGAVSLPGQIPAHLLKLQDGRILLTYGTRNGGHYGVDARISDDNGASWSKPVFLVDFITATDGGYPSCVQTSDGTLVLAYYANRVPQHQRYHMGVVRFRIDELF
ncbi:MAG: exo-alpha-sialidase [Paenibacillaceae bacterium]|nr:exo-alpha-sialidase [Paenibacillaceae bacterium]